MAYMTQTKSGRWRVQVECAGHRSSRTFDGKREAKAWAASIEREHIKRRAYRTRAPTFRVVEAPPDGFSMLDVDAILELAKGATSTCGVYFLVAGGRIVYVGQSRHVEWRIASHSAAGRVFDAYAVVPCERKHLDMVEASYILRLKPEWNLREDGSPVLPVQRKLVSA